MINNKEVEYTSELSNIIKNTDYVEMRKNFYENIINLSATVREKNHTDIILVQPIYPSSPFPGPNLNVGLGYIAEQLASNKITYEVADISIDGKEILFEKIKTFNPSYIGLSLMSLDADKHYALIKEIKKNFPNTRIITGGPHVSFIKTRILEECSAIDYAIVYEGEDTLTELINNVSIEKIRGLIYRKKDGSIAYNKDRYFINDLDRLPFPKYRNFQMAKYGNIIPVATSRGCPYSCTFCGAHLSMGKKWRIRSVHSVIEELQYWHDKGYKNFNFVDSNFFMSHQRVIKLCNFLESKNIKITITSDGMRAKDANREMLKKLKRFGLQSVAIGIESANDDILRSIKKAETLSDMEQCLELLKELNISVVAFFIIGLPGETIRHVLNSFSFALKYTIIRSAFFFNPNPLPGTEMYKLAENNNMIRATEDKILDNIGGMDNEILIETPELPIKERKILLKMSKDVSRIVELQHKLYLSTTNNLPISTIISINNEIKQIKNIMINDMKMLLHLHENLHLNDIAYKTINNPQEITQAKSEISNSIFYIKDQHNTLYYKNNEIINLKNADTIFTHLTIKEKVKLMELATKVNGRTYVEIGSYLGASSCFIAAGIRKRGSNGKLFCVDTWQNDAMSEGNRDTYKEFLQNTDKYQKHIIIMRGKSVEVAKKFTEKIDFLFLDGDHSYEGIKSDVEAWFPKLNRGAVIIFHDTGWAEGVQKIIREKILQFVENSEQLPNMFWAWLKTQF